MPLQKSWMTPSKANLTLTMHDNTKLTYAQAGNTIEMTYYADRDGTTQVNANNSSTRVRSFTIHVKAGNDQNPVRSISVTGIPTHEERGDVPTGEVWTYKNTIHIDGVNGKASDTDTYRSYKKFEKGVAATSSGNETGYLTGSNTFEKNDLGGHKLRYQLVLQTDRTMRMPSKSPISCRKMWTSQSTACRSRWTRTPL